MTLFKKPISISFAPNVEIDDFLLALKLLLPAFLGRSDKQWVKKLEDSFKQYLGVTDAFAFSSGRAAFYYILKSLSLAPRDEILIQAFTCVAVPNAILWAELTPVYVDIDKHTFNMDCDDLKKKLTSKSKVIVVQHTFGIPSNMDEIKKIAQHNNLIIIEDCAHSLGAEYEGKKVGSLSDVAFFSFGRDKVISSVFGGMVTTNNKKVAINLQHFYKNLESPARFFVIKQLLYIILYTLLLPFYNMLIGKLILKLLFAGNILSKAVSEEEKKAALPEFINYQLSPFLARLAQHQLEKVSRFNNHRQQIARIYIETLKNNTGTKIAAHSNSKPVYLRFPVLVTNKYDLLKKAQNKGIHLGNWYENPITPKPYDVSTFKYKRGSCPVAEKVCPMVINLPTHINLKKTDAQLIANVVSHYLNSDINKP